MKIKTIEIENYKSIEKLTLDFDSNSKVIIGSDDKTRTDVLDAIAIAISSFFSGFSGFDELDPEKISTKDGYKQLGEVVYPIRISSKLEIENKTIETVTELLDDTVQKTGIRKQKNKELVELSKDIRHRIMSGQSFPLPLIAYYPADREVLVSDTIIDPDLMPVSSRIAGYYLCLSEKRNLDVLKWLMACEFVEYHTKQNISILRYFKEILGLFDLPKDPFYEWSESTRNTKYLFSIVADLAFRSAYLNPEFCHWTDIQRYGAYDSGVVLIDAIELNLDLEWQREILPKLRFCFPKIQFIVTTESPLVLSTANEFYKETNSIVILEHDYTEEPFKITPKSTDYFYGKSCDRILEDLLDTPARPERIKQILHYLFKMIDEGNIDEAIATKEDLTKLIGADYELTKAEVLIERKQSLAKQVT